MSLVLQTTWSTPAVYDGCTVCCKLQICQCMSTRSRDVWSHGLVPDRKKQIHHNRTIFLVSIFIFSSAHHDVSRTTKPPGPLQLSTMTALYVVSCRYSTPCSHCQTSTSSARAASRYVPWSYLFFYLSLTDDIPVLFLRGVSLLDVCVAHLSLLGLWAGVGWREQWMWGRGLRWLSGQKRMSCSACHLKSCPPSDPIVYAPPVDASLVGLVTERDPCDLG